MGRLAKILILHPDNILYKNNYLTKVTQILKRQVSTDLPVCVGQINYIDKYVL